ncbi:hypothetical protein MMC34_008075 [Xylographa carneopallida]|nr:hypothetical protein [Xylographa carneopallida]
MSSTFNHEVEAFNKAKQPFMELLIATLIKQEQSKETAGVHTPIAKDGAEHNKLSRAENYKPSTRDSEYPKTKSLELLAMETPSFPRMDPMDLQPASVIARMSAAARQLSEAGKSKTIKAQWDEIDTILGFNDYKE